MWGSLARGITQSVRETASHVAPTAGSVLRRVGEVVAPAADEDYSDEEQDVTDDEVEYDEDDDEGLDFQQEDGNLLDRYRNKAQLLTSPFRSQPLEEFESSNQDQESPLSVNSNHREEWNGETDMQDRDTNMHEEFHDESSLMQLQQIEDGFNIRENRQESQPAEIVEDDHRFDQEGAPKVSTPTEMEDEKLLVQQEKQENIEKEEEERRREQLLVEARLKAEVQERKRLEEEAEQQKILQEKEKEERKAREKLAAERKEREDAALKSAQWKRLQQQERERKEAEEVAARRAEHDRVIRDEKKKESEDYVPVEIIQREKQKEEEKQKKEEEVRYQNQSAIEAPAAANAEIGSEQLVSNKLEQEVGDVNDSFAKSQHDAQEYMAQVISLQRELDERGESNEKMQTVIQQLQKDLHRAAETIADFRMKNAQQEDEKVRQAEETRRVEEEESAFLASLKLDMENQMELLRESLTSQIVSLEKELNEERKTSVEQQQELRKKLEEATMRLSASETEMSTIFSKKEAKLTKQLQAAEKAAAKAVALLDQKEQELQQLQTVIIDMRETMKKNKREEEEAEEEMDELHHENEELHHQLEKLQKENSEIKNKLATMSNDSEKLGGLKMELQMLEEERQREKALLESANEKTSEDFAVVLSEREDAKAKVIDLEQQLIAARADVELASTDHNRAVMANENLQRALEAFQSERDAEIELLMEQRAAAEVAILAAHSVALEAMREANAAEMRDIQYATDKSLKNSLVEMDKMEATIQECRKDNLNLRRALDEAIARLQTSQEDVIDRNLIKNIILDWHVKKGKAKRDVMILLGSILHFTEDEKDKALIGEGPGSFDKIVGVVAAPLPPAKLNVDKIEGDSVREKWVNFLLAETGEDEN